MRCISWKLGNDSGSGQNSPCPVRRRSMLTFPKIDPVAVAIGPLKIRWYALTYIVGFAAAWWLGTRRAAKPGSGWTKEQVADLVTNGMLGAILGGRIGYILFYNFAA